ncbi:unnamed protein product [Leptidea sinapis]|nr:unnamed protein product [Leptidea sinapis]
MALQKSEQDIIINAPWGKIMDIPGNGLSDHLPPGVKYTVFDLIPAIHNVVEHFKWDRFIYIGHSLGTVIDPIPLYETRSPSQFQSWYKAYYREYYDAARYKIFTNGKENAPKYTIEEVYIRPETKDDNTNTIFP